MELAPDRCHQAKSGEDHEHRSAELPDPIGEDIVHQSPRSDTAGKRRKSRPHPRCVGPLGGEESPVAGEHGAPVSAVRQLVRALFNCARAPPDLSSFLVELVLFTFHRPSDARTAMQFHRLASV